jgi:putative hemolysin
MTEKKPIQIDIAKVLKDKAPNTKVPKFVVNILRRIAHEDDFNDFFRKNPDVKNLEFMEATFRYLEISVDVEGRENLPREGRSVFVSNHPLGGLDGVTISYILSQTYGSNIRSISNDLLMNLEPLREMFVPVNKVGAQSKKLSSQMDELFASDYQIMTFPAGVCSRKINGKVCDLEWKKSFVSKAIEHQRNVVPIYFDGKNSKFFYNLARLRKALGIKFNIEMMFLADEMFKQRGNHFRVVIGKPIPWQTFDKTKSPQKWAQWVKDIVYSMEK